MDRLYTCSLSLLLSTIEVYHCQTSGRGNDQVEALIDQLYVTMPHCVSLKRSHASTSICRILAIPVPYVLTKFFM